MFDSDEFDNASTAEETAFDTAFTFTFETEEADKRLISDTGFTAVQE